MERGITSPATQTAGEYGCQTSPATQTATAAESLARELRERLIRALCGEPAFDQAQGCLWLAGSDRAGPIACSTARDRQTTGSSRAAMSCYS
jgi:hypothetical protein